MELELVSSDTSDTALPPARDDLDASTAASLCQWSQEGSVSITEGSAENYVSLVGISKFQMIT